MSHQKTRTPNRLITFETDEEEQLVVLAGRDQMDSRTIYSGSTSGRYAIVPVQELADTEAPRREDVDEDLDLDEMQLVGDTIVIPENGAAEVGLHSQGEQVKRMDRAGAYAMLWVPFES